MPGGVGGGVSDGPAYPIRRAGASRIGFPSVSSQRPPFDTPPPKRPGGGTQDWTVVGLGGVPARACGLWKHHSFLTPFSL